MPDLVDSGRNLGQVLPDAGHGELDLVADTLLWTFGWMCNGDAEEEAEQQNPGGVGTELLLRVHLRTTAFDRCTQTDSILPSENCLTELKGKTVNVDVQMFCINEQRFHGKTVNYYLKCLHSRIRILNL